jgi:hypothetical protein
MQEVLHWATTALRVLLAATLALAPGMSVWLLVIGVVLILRRLGDSDLVQGLRLQGGPG